jgi:hypothetical protein
MTDNPNAQISLEDLNSAVTMIGVAVKRGAYEPTEVRRVGEVFERITGFLQIQVDAAKEAEAAKEAADADAEPATEADAAPVCELPSAPTVKAVN